MQYTKKTAKNVKEKLTAYTGSTNLVKEFDKAKLHKIADAVVSGYDEDYRSISERLRYCARALELADLKRQKKHTPMRDASNIKIPIISTASMQFTARSLPELLKSGEVVNYRIVGNDNTGSKNRLGKRLKAFLNWQILEHMKNWLDGRDKLLTHLSIIGTVFTKTWFDPISERPKSEMIPYDEIVVNDYVSSLEDAERVTQIICLSMKDVIEQNRHQLFEELDASYYDDESDAYKKAQEFLEQHCFMDLDEDGYPEPYIITVHKESKKVVRIVTRFDLDDVKFDDAEQVMSIKAEMYFSDYHFLPDPHGHFHSQGFGTYLLDLNESINTIHNLLIDAGKLANLQGGFIGSGMRLKNKTLDMEPGEWKILESVTGDGIKNNIVPMNYKEPSQVLLALLGSLTESAKSFTSTTDALTGMADGNNTSPNTMYSLIQQSLKVYSTIIRRVGRGHKKEISKIVAINRKFLNYQDYVNVVDPSPEEIMEMYDYQTGEILDFKNAKVDVVPVTDSSMSTETELLFKSQMELEAGMAFAQMGVVDPRELAIKRFTALESTGIDKLVPPPQQPKPDPDMVKIQADMQIKSLEMELRNKDLQLKAIELEAKLKNIESQTIKNLADAAATGEATQITKYKTLSDSLLNSAQLQVEAHKIRLENEANKGSDS